ncbi:MAG TPA: AsnC family transcriptional regulator [Syntrophomonadaceae bacterium]|nr:AsnC family transcriptional regulator [Syntrophomonadaceae bacterium]
MPALDSIDRQILNLLQNDFPVAAQPFKIMAERMGISEGEVLSRIGSMKSAGLIRRIGGIMDTRSLGYYSTLCTAMVPDSRVDEAAEAINRLPGVTHNYLRDHDYNLWFTLTVPTREEADRILTELESELGVEIVSMPAEKVFKIRVNFDMETNDED